MLPTRPCATDHNLLRSAVQPFLNPPHCPLIQSTLPEFAYENVVKDRVESLAEAEVDSIYCSPLISPGSCLIIKQLGWSSMI